MQRSLNTFFVSLLLAASFAGVPLEGQQPAPQARAGASPVRGWIGVEFALQEISVRVGGNRTEGRLGILVRNVMPGGPAARAGLRPGDWIVSVEGQPATWQVLTGRLEAVRPGDPVRVRVERGNPGDSESVTITPSVRPLLFQGEAVAMSFDSLRQRLILNLDSIRSEFLRLQSADNPAGPRVVVLEEHRLPAVSPGFPDAVRLRSDGSGIRGPAGTLHIREAPGAPERGTMTVIFSGHRTVGGAELTPLNPELARYFGTDQGLLVVQVIEGTPAGRAGLQGGDVIREVNGERVSEVEAFRRALDQGYRTPPVPITVIRDRNRVVLRFER